MITHIPSDFELTFPYRELERRLGAPKAAWAFFKLWTDLAFQTRVHGMAGLYKKEYHSFFEQSLRPLVPNAVSALLNSGMMKLKDDGDWFCPIFAKWNVHLDASYIPTEVGWFKEWAKWEQKMAERGKEQHRWVPKIAWYMPPECDVVPEAIMNKALVLINILDVILHRKARHPKELGVGLIHGAIHVVLTSSEAKISVITKRFMAISRPTINPLFPATTEDAIKYWDDLVIRLVPDSGYEAWTLRLEQIMRSRGDEDQLPDQVAIGESIKEDIDNGIERIQAQQ